MKLVTVHNLVAKLIKEGKSNKEIRSFLFSKNKDTKGIKLEQIQIVMKLIEEPCN